MATWRERFWATIDRWIGWDFGDGNMKHEHTRSFYTNWGTRMAIIQKNGSVRVLGGSRWVVHHYDASGHLISRTLKRKTLEEGERVVYGREAEEAYLNQPTLWSSSSGGMAN